jgi:hypothetical protein
MPTVPTAMMDHGGEMEDFETFRESVIQSEDPGNCARSHESAKIFPKCYLFPLRLPHLPALTSKKNLSKLQFRREIPSVGSNFQFGASAQSIQQSLNSMGISIFW